MNIITEKVFGKNVELLDSVTELFELELAYLEFNCLPKNEILKRTAYIKSINGEMSLHFKLYSNKLNVLTEESTGKIKNYFENGQFSTGYATHGLFPYRGKFHPQLIKALINIIGLTKGDILLDPMCGSGTANIEASLIGIDSIAIDISPFCRLMTEVKFEALTADIEILKTIEQKTGKLFEFFNRKNVLEKIDELEDRKRKIYRLALLAFLDSWGYSMRVTKSSHEMLFYKVLKRYIQTVLSIANNKDFDKNQIGNVQVLPNSDALNIKLDDESVDGIITSPPYSFAIDYAENDRPQLEFLGYDIDELKAKMIGLKGKTKQDKLNNYFDDMERYCFEIARILKKGKYFTLIIGSNTNQTGGVRLEKSIIDSAQSKRLILTKSLLKPIKGMRNTMKDEYILFFQKT